MLKSLQVCRAIAAILVVLFHASGSIFALPKYFDHKPFGDVFDFGYAGVDFFFVLSGFIMMYVHADDIGQPRALGSYLWKRFSRIYPVYWIVLAAIVPVYFLVPSFGLGYERDLGVLLRSALLLPGGDNRLVLVVAWTLVYEVFFYVLFGVLILNCKLGIAVLVGWTACIIVSLWMDTGMSAFLVSEMNLRFLAGIGVALVLARWRMPTPGLLTCAGASLFAGTGMLEVYGGVTPGLINSAGYTLGSAVTLLGAVEAERSGLIDPRGWLVYLGDASYSIYLVHFPALSLLAKLAVLARLDSYLPGAVLYVLHVVGAIAIGCLVHELIEKPIHVRAKRWFQRAKPGNAPIAAVRRAA